MSGFEPLTVRLQGASQRYLDVARYVHMLADLLARQGRASETIAVVADLAAGDEGMTPGLFLLRARAPA